MHLWGSEGIGDTRGLRRQALRQWCAGKASHKVRRENPGACGSWEHEGPPDLLRCAAAANCGHVYAGMPMAAGPRRLPHQRFQHEEGRAGRDAARATDDVQQPGPRRRLRLRLLDGVTLSARHRVWAWVSERRRGLGLGAPGTGRPCARGRADGGAVTDSGCVLVLGAQTQIIIDLAHEIKTASNGSSRRARRQDPRGRPAPQNPSALWLHRSATRSPALAAPSDRPRPRTGHANWVPEVPARQISRPLRPLRP